MYIVGFYFFVLFKFDMVMWFDMAHETVSSGKKTLGHSGQFHIPASLAIATNNMPNGSASISLHH